MRGSYQCSIKKLRDPTCSQHIHLCAARAQAAVERKSSSGQGPIGARHTYLHKWPARLCMMDKIAQTYVEYLFECMYA